LNGSLPLPVGHAGHLRLHTLVGSIMMLTGMFKGLTSFNLRLVQASAKLSFFVLL
jgi:hypothetical protein